MPSAAEFGRALQESNIYGNTALCRFLLLDIENGDRKEVLRPETLTIEHIMPQKLGVDWSHISPEEHDAYLHTLGNLSVTGYNSELSNKSFREKQEIIRENTKATVLNCDVLDKETWGIEDIRNRAKRLAGLVLERYRVEKVDDDSIEFEYAETMTLDDIDEVSGKKLVSFRLFGETYRQSRYSLMLLGVIKLLDKAYPGRLSKLAERSFSFSSKRVRNTHLNTDGAGLRNPLKVTEGVYAEGNLSAWACMRFVEGLLAEYGVDRREFSFKVIAEEPEDDGDGVCE